MLEIKIYRDKITNKMNGSNETLYIILFDKISFVTFILRKIMPIKYIYVLI